MVASMMYLSTGSEVAAQPEPFAREAKFLSESKALGRDVRVMLEGIDKFGNLFGQVITLPPVSTLYGASGMLQLLGNSSSTSAIGLSIGLCHRRQTQ